MKKLFIIILLLAAMSITTSALNFYLTPLKENSKTYSSSEGKAKAKVNLELGKIYLSTKNTADRFYIDELNSWVARDAVEHNMKKMVIQYKAQYLTKYKDDKSKEIQRRKDAVSEHPELSKKVKKDILEGNITQNWPESLVVLSWGEPERRADFTNTKGISEKRLLWGQTMLIFENDSLKYKKTHFTGALSVHLEKKRKEVEDADRSVTDSTLLGDLKFDEEQ